MPFSAEEVCYKLRKQFQIKVEFMVPVLDTNRVPLMPCSEKRARKMQECGKAKGFWRNGIFCIILQVEPSARNYQEVAVGVDPGSLREGYTVATKKAVVLNILTDTPVWVKERVGSRSVIRRSRRKRKAPYRKCRLNRKQSGIPPSTRSRWNAKLRIIAHLQKILPLTHINVEDVCAKTKKNCRNWNKHFSPVQTGKNWFYLQLEKLHLILAKTKGYATKEHRDLRGFKKISNKKADKWEAHNVDSHSLCEMQLNVQLPIVRKIHKILFFRFYRRQLHVQLPIKGNVRKPFGGTVSMGISKGTLVMPRKSKYAKVYVGGYSKSGISLHCCKTKKIINKSAKPKDLIVVKKLQWLTAII